MEKRTVLFVDDEEKILRSLKRSLMDEPYETLFANSGKEALEILQQHEAHVIVSDIRMPEMDGLELLKIVKEEFPHIIRLVLSGCSEADNILNAINNGEVLRFITKPWKSDGNLKTTIRQAIEYYDLHSEREMLMTFFEQLVVGKEPDEINLRLINMLIEKRKRHLYEWSMKCHPVLKDQ
ncbi:MAG: response regulator [Planctomycetes bacterium]|nr:response regulator [Planctomycetota bacterium]